MNDDGHDPLAPLMAMMGPVLRSLHIKSHQEGARLRVDLITANLDNAEKALTLIGALSDSASVAATEDLKKAVTLEPSETEIAIASQMELLTDVFDDAIRGAHLLASTNPSDTTDPSETEPDPDSAATAAATADAIEAVILDLSIKPGFAASRVMELLAKGEAFREELRKNHGSNLTAWMASREKLNSFRQANPGHTHQLSFEIMKLAGS